MGAERDYGHRAWIDAVAPRIDGEAILRDVEAVARHHRIQASPGYAAAAHWLIDALRDSGLEPDVEEVPADGHQRYLGMVMPEGWACTRGVCTLHAGGPEEPLADTDDHPLAVVQRSAPASGEHELVSLDDGTEPEHYIGRDVRGRIVLTSGHPHRVHRLAVVERGAAGLLCDGRRLLPPVRTEETDRDALAYTSFWWAEDEPRGWGFVISPARGRALRRRLAAGESLRLRVAIESHFQPTQVPLVSTVLPGSTGHEILVTAHLCHPFPGANDNASGVAAALGAARALLGCRRDGMWPAQSHGIRFLWMPEFTGTHAWASRHPARARIRAALDLDMVGASQERCGSTQLLERAPHFLASIHEELAAQVRHATQRWVNSYSGPGHYSLTRMAEVPYSGGSDHAVWLDPALAGVSAPMLIQWPDRFYHSSSDRPEQCDPESLAHAARFAAAYAATLASADARAQRGWFELAGRTARRRLYAALDHPDATRQAHAEMHRGIRLLTTACAWPAADDGPAPTHTELADAVEALAAFFDAEIAPQLTEPWVAAAVAGGDQVPLRLLGAPLDLQRHLLPGWSRLSTAEQEAWRRRDLATPGGSTVFDLAWYAADGVRTVATIADLIALEGHVVPLATLESFFSATHRLGLSRWAEDGPGATT